LHIRLLYERIDLPSFWIAFMRIVTFARFRREMRPIVLALTFVDFAGNSADVSGESVDNNSNGGSLL
jgi:hypothetical protein